MIARGPSPTVTIEEALASTSARAERDRQLAVWCGLGDDETDALVSWWRGFDERTATWEARRALREREAVLARREAVEDTPAGMRVRVDAVIADLVEQLADDGCFARRMAA